MLNWQIGSFSIKNANVSRRPFVRLQYPESLVQTAVRQFIETKVVARNTCVQHQSSDQQEVPIRVFLPFKDQKSASYVYRQLGDLSRKINTENRPVKTSLKIKDEIKVKDQTPVVNQQCAIYQFKRDLCDLCDTDYAGYSRRHLHQRIEEHKGSAIGCHLKQQHGKSPEDIAKNFHLR